MNCIALGSRGVHLILTFSLTQLRADGPDTAPVSPPTEPAGIPLLYVLVAGGIVLGLLALALVWFLVVVPYRRKAPLRRALNILDSNEQADFPEAERLLTRVLTEGLGWRDVAIARFALAYVRARLRKFADAAAVLVDLKEEAEQRRTDLDAETIYLDLWIQHQLKSHDRVEAIYEEHGDLLHGVLDASLIYGIALLQKANRYWMHQEFDRAISAFERLRQLDVLVEEIPPHLDNHQVVLGVVSLGNGNVIEARACFLRAIETAQTQGLSPTRAELGLLLCDWNDRGESGWGHEHDDKLRTVLEALPAPTDGKGQKEEETLSDQGGRGDDEESDDQGVEKKLEDATLLARNVGFWYALSLMQTWFARPARSGLEARERRQLERRLMTVQKVDPQFPDPRMVAGLVLYYFAADDAERQRGVKWLRESRDRGVNLPEVLTLLTRIEKADKLEQDHLQTFLTFLRKMLSDQNVPPYLRQQMKDYFERNQRFKSLGEVEVERGEDDPTGWLGNLQGRFDVVLKRLARHLQKTPDDGDPQQKEEIEKLLGELPGRMEELVARARSVEEEQARAVMLTAEIIFPEENDKKKPAPASPTQSASETIRFTCEKCSRSLKAPGQHAGKKVKCPGCQSVLTVPPKPQKTA